MISGSYEGSCNRKGEGLILKIRVHKEKFKGGSLFQKRIMLKVE